MQRIFNFLFTVLNIFSLSGQNPNFQWVKGLETTGLVDAGYGVAVDASGNVYTAGTFHGTIDLDPGPGTYTLVGSNGTWGLGDGVFISKLDASGNFIWGKSFGSITGSSVHGYGLAIDAANSLYLTGFFSDTTDFDPGLGTYTLCPGFLANNYEDTYVVKLDGNGNFIWARQLGGFGGGDGNGITVDGSGNVYSTGYFTGNTDLDPGPGTFSFNSAGGNDIFLSKLNSVGNFVWGKTIGGSSSDYGSSVKVDGLGNVFVCGYFSGNVDFDPGPGFFTLFSNGSTDAFILKLDPAGNFVWAHNFGDINGDGINTLALDGSGNIYAGGYFQNTVDFDPGSSIFNLVSAGSTDIFILKLNASGNFVWAKNMGGVNWESAYSIAIDATGSVYSTGFFQGPSDFDPGIGTFTLASVDTRDIFISKLDASGNFDWAVNFGNNSIDNGNSITVDPSFNVYTTGNYNSTIDFDPGAGVSNLTSSLGCDIFVHKMNQPPLKIKELNTKNKSNIYPNPNNGSFTIELSFNSEVTIDNVLGESVFNEKLSAGDQKIHLENHPTGVYFVHVKEKDSSPITQQIVITK